ETENLDGTIRHHNSVLVLGTETRAGSVHHLQEVGGVLRMHPLANPLERYERSWFEPIDAVELFRPTDLVVVQLPSEAAGFADGLTLGEDSFAATERIFGNLALGYVL